MKATPQVTTTKGTVKRLGRATLAARVAEQIRDGILDGSFGPGAQLNEAELAEQFDISRGPVREGLQRLIQEGLLRSEPHRGVFVPVLSAEDLSDICFAREAVEGAAIRRIMTTAGSDAAESLLPIVEEMTAAAAAGDWRSVAAADMRFHTHLVVAAGSVRLSRMYSTLIAETQLSLRMTASDYPGREHLVAEHLELAKLIGSGDLDAALRCLSAHFADTITTITRPHQTDQPDPSDPPDSAV